MVALGMAGAAPAAHAADAFFPGDAPPPTQVTRELTLRQAAQAGLIKLQAKGGPEGDAVSLELEHKKVRAPVTVSVRIEFTVPPRVTPEKRELIRDALPEIEANAEQELNRHNYKTRDGDPIRFDFHYRFRDPEAPETFNYHQVLILNPNIDLDEPDPNYRSRVNARGVPNKFGSSANGRFSVLSFDGPTMAHETLHFAGLDDRYSDYYRVGGKDYPLPRRGMSKSQLAEFASGHKPPLRRNGKVVVKDSPGTKRCDFMGSGLLRKCRKVSRRDLDWLASQAGVQVVAQPGDVLLNKETDRQNFGVGFRTIVFAAPGSTTVANGISVFCMDHGRFIPFTSTFDVLGPASELPGYEPLAKLLALSGRMQPSLEETLPGMLNAVWNVTDALPLETSGTATESRALLTQAGVAENSVPGGLTDIVDPNAGSPETAGVTTQGTLPSIPSSDSKPPLMTRVQFATITPSRVAAGRRAFTDLLVSAVGDVKKVSIRLERRGKGRWRRVRSLGSRRMAAGKKVFQLKLGRLRRGPHRLVVSVAGPFGKPASARVKLAVR
jgi:hypothetical protein